MKRYHIPTTVQTELIFRRIVCSSEGGGGGDDFNTGTEGKDQGGARAPLP